MILGKFRIVGHSMSPGIAEGKEVLVSSIPYLLFEPKVGDVGAFKKGNKVFIKRIKKVKKDKYCLIGDNEKDSLDSRNFGSIDKKNIIGKVIRVL